RVPVSGFKRSPPRQGSVRSTWNTRSGRQYVAAFRASVPTDTSRCASLTSPSRTRSPSPSEVIASDTEPPPPNGYRHLDRTLPLLRVDHGHRGDAHDVVDLGAPLQHVD